MGTREGVAAKIEAETRVKIDEMNRMVKQQQEPVCISFFYNNNKYLINILCRGNFAYSNETVKNTQT